MTRVISFRAIKFILLPSFNKTISYQVKNPFSDMPIVVLHHLYALNHYTLHPCLRV